VGDDAQSVRREATVRTASRAVSVVTAPSVTRSLSVSVAQAGTAKPAINVSHGFTLRQYSTNIIVFSLLFLFLLLKKVKASHTRYQALGLELIPVYRQSGDLSDPAGGRLSLLSARPTVTFPAAEHHRPSAGRPYLFYRPTEGRRLSRPVDSISRSVVLL